jgi:hypothetical protein
MTEASAINGNEAAHEHGLDSIPPDQLVHVINVAFTERFLGGTRIRGERGFAWRNASSGVVELQPFEVSRHIGQMMSALQQFSELPDRQYVWTVERRGDGLFSCQIGRVTGAELTELAVLAGISSPELGLSIAFAMLGAAGFDFMATHKDLYDNAPRIQLDH